MCRTLRHSRRRRCRADFRITQKVKKADTLIYDFQFRRVEVNPNSLEISPNLIPQLSQPVTVGGPASRISTTRATRAR